MLLAGKDEVLEALREQYLGAEVSYREFTGVGFFTGFQVKDECVKIQKKNFHIGDVDCYLNKEKISVGFVLFIRKGQIDFLEGYTYDTDWPSEIHEYDLTYVNGVRDMEQLRKSWQ